MLAQLVQGLRGTASLATLRKMHINLKITRILRIILHFIWINIGLVEGVDNILAIFQEAGIEGKSADQLLVPRVYESNEDIARQLQPILQTVIQLLKHLNIYGYFLVFLHGVRGQRPVAVQTRPILVGSSIFHEFRIIRPYKLKILPIKYLDAQINLASRGTGQPRHGDLHQFLHRRRPHLPLKHLLKVLDVALLGGLRAAAAVLEAHRAVVGQGVDEVGGEAGVDEGARYRRARAPLPRIAVHYNHILLILVHILKHLVAAHEQHQERGRVVVLPVVRVHTKTKFTFVYLLVA